MTGWLDPVRWALVGHPRPSWFFRDDDAGWNDRRLDALTTTFRAAGVHVDLAAIPAALTPGLGRRLAGLSDEGFVSVHQHGWAHMNHESSGRRSEFGPSRAASAQARDIAQGRAVLAERLGRAPTSVFVPPWNRCTPVTAGLLPGLGLTTLSVDRTAPRLGFDGLAVIPVAVDWSRSFSRGGRAAVAAELSAAALASPAPLGVMLHHAVMDKEELQALQELLGLLSASPGARLTSLIALADESGLTPVSRTRHRLPARSASAIKTRTKDETHHAH